MGCYLIKLFLHLILQEDGGTPQLVVVSELVLPAVDGGYGYIPFLTDVCDRQTVAFTAGNKRTHMVCIISKHIHDKSEAVPAVWRDHIEQVCMYVIAGIAVEAINGYPCGIGVMALVVFGGD